MATFAYTALDAATGSEVRGDLEAEDAPAAAASLRRRALFPLALAPRAAAPTRARRARRGVFRFTRRRDVIFFLRQLGLMLRAGLTLLQALDVARENCPKPALARAIARIRVAVESGRSLAEALAGEKKLFPEIGWRLISSAEASGELDVTLERVAVHIERNLELRNTLMASLIYPLVLVLATLGVVVFLVTKVIPTFAKFLEKRRVALPWAARTLLDVSAFVQHYGVAIGLVALGLVLGLVLLRTRPRGRRAFDRALLSIPIVGGAISAAVMAEIGTTFAMLLRGGVTLLEALRLLSSTVLNKAVASQLESAADGVLRGQDLASGIDHPTFPLLFTQVVAVGERTGALDHVLEEIGRYYDAELRTRVRQLTVLFEPCVIAVVGGIVGFVYFAFFQALLQLAARGGR
jgi:type IV pilus assembly protein PilC